MLNIYQLEQRIQHATEAQRVVGLALVMIQNAEVVYARGFGVTSLEEGASPSPLTRSSASARSAKL